MTRLAAALVLLVGLAAAPLRSAGDQAPGPVGIARMARTPVSGETAGEVRVQGAVFGGGLAWNCLGRRCDSHVVGWPAFLPACRALVAEVGPVVSFRTGDRWFRAEDLAVCNEAAAPPPPPPAPGEGLALAPRGDGWELTLPGQRPLEVPRRWVLAEEEDAERDAHVPSTDLDAAVQVFPIGDGRTGLRLTSYAVSREGSAQAAAGRDVFLVLDREGGAVSDGGPRLGLTRSRGRASGRWSARFHRFYVQDVTRDGRADLGVVEERLVCAQPGRPRLEVSRPRWLVFRRGQWVHDREWDGKVPTSSTANELRPLGLERTPVEFVAQRCAEAAR